VQQVHCHCPAIVLIPACRKRIKAVAKTAGIDDKHRAKVLIPTEVARDSGMISPTIPI
jgi:hypothetical protein